MNFGQKIDLQKYEDALNDLGNQYLDIFETEYPNGRIKHSWIESFFSRSWLEIKSKFKDVEKEIFKEPDTEETTDAKRMIRSKFKTRFENDLRAIQDRRNG